MGAGGSLEAAYTLKSSVPAGTYHFIIDSIIIRPVDVTFDLIWRRESMVDTTITSWQVHFDPLPGANFDAQPYEVDMAGPAIDFTTGDKLVFRYSAANTIQAEAYIPNGDGEHANGRIPNITLPK